MAIQNFICPNCRKFIVCTWKDNLAKFSEDAKKPIGVDITMDKCDEYEEQ